MPRFKVAQVREQGQDIIMVPLGAAFGLKGSETQEAVVVSLQTHALDAGLAGTVVPVWDAGDGRLGFIAPQPWHAFFRNLDLSWVFARVNRELSW